MEIRRLVGGVLESNGYIIYDKKGGEAYVIDPGYGGGRFIKEAAALEVKVKGILLTHHHYDHTGAVDKVRQAWECPVFLHWDDCAMCRKEVDRPLSGGETLKLGTEVIEVIHTPGHTKGGVCFYCGSGKVCFTGDTIFNVDLGRTDLEDGDEEAMRRSIRDVISAWGSDITIYPGHGDPCTMKYVREHNREYRELAEGR
ncbi:MAG: MBL fold metallo-hydrolase [Bacillota bacterium]|nr:MBL fold metallo-hydrolase [Bacillota bacterium]